MRQWGAIGRIIINADTRESLAAVFLSRARDDVETYIYIYTAIR